MSLEKFRTGLATWASSKKNNFLKIYRMTEPGDWLSKHEQGRLSVYWK